MRPVSRTLNTFVRDKHGHISVWQMPNPPLIAWFALMLLSALIRSPHLNAGLQLLSTAALFTWAYLELTSGTSYFRRTLGAIVLLDIFATHLF